MTTMIVLKKTQRGLSRLHVYIGIAGITGIVGLFGASCGDESAKESPIDVPTTTSSEPIKKTVEFKGVVTTRESKVIAAEYEGRVIKIYVQEGQRVSAGTPIVKLDDSVVRTQLAGAVAAADAARADRGRAAVEIAAAKRSVRMQRRLYRSGATAREQTRNANFERARAGASYGSAAASYRRAMAEKRQLEAKLKKSILLAPIDGVVSMIRLKEGEMARPGMAVARVFDPSDLTVRFAIEQEHRDLIKKNTKVSATIPSTGASFEVVVESVSSALEPPLQFLVARADIDDHQVNINDVGIGAIGRFRLTYTIKDARVIASHP